MKDPVDQLEGVSYGAGRGEGAEVEGAILFDPADDAQARKGGSNIKPKTWIPLVVS